MTACKPMAVPAWPENGHEVPTDPATVECLLFDVLQLKALWVRRRQWISSIGWRRSIWSLRGSVVEIIFGVISCLVFFSFIGSLIVGIGCLVVSSAVEAGELPLTPEAYGATCATWHEVEAAPFTHHGVAYPALVHLPGTSAESARRGWIVPTWSAWVVAVRNGHRAWLSRLGQIGAWLILYGRCTAIDIRHAA